MKFYEQFPPEEHPPTRTKEVFRMIKIVIPALCRYTFEYFNKGPTLKDWNLPYFLAVKTVKAFLLESRQGPYPDVAATQRRNARPSKVPKDVSVIPSSIQQNQKVIDFIKENARGEWPDQAASISKLYAEWVVTNQVDPEYIILYLHGGAYVLGSAEMARFMTSKFTKYGNCKVFAINYRLAPQNPYPCALIDAVSAYMQLLEHYDPSKIIISGESAGGGLTLAALMVIRDMKLPMPLGGYCISPWVDLTHSCASFEDHEPFDYLPEPQADPRLGDRLHYYTENQYLKVPYVSPLFGHITGLPPLLIQCGTAERLYGENKLFAEKQGIIHFEEYQSHVHVFPIFPFAKGSKAALTRFGDWFDQITGREMGFENHSKHTILDFNGSIVDELQ